MLLTGVLHADVVGLAPSGDLIDMPLRLRAVILMVCLLLAAFLGRLAVIEAAMVSMEVLLALIVLIRLRLINLNTCYVVVEVGPEVMMVHQVCGRRLAALRVQDKIGAQHWMHHGYQRTSDARAIFELDAPALLRHELI